MELFNNFDIKDDIVIIPANRVNKFKRENPTTQNIREYLKSQVDLNGDAMYNSEQRAYFSINYSEKNKLLLMDPNRVDDEDIKILIEVAKRNDIVTPPEYDKNRKRAEFLSLPFVRFKPGATFTSLVDARYPLLNIWSTGIFHGPHLEHMYLYINACVQARKNGKIV
jgi:hypothetical protein